MAQVIHDTAALASVARQAQKPERHFATAGRQSLVALRAERCRKIALPGPEDVAVDHEQGIAYVSSQKRKRPLADASESGAIYALDLKFKGENIRNSTGECENLTEPILHQLGSFHPLGIDLFFGDNQKARLLVINQANDGCRVEIFEILNRTANTSKSGNLELKHICTVGPHELLTFPNSIAACAWDEFYLTNPRKFIDPGAFVNDMLHLRSGRVLHCRFSEAGDATWTLADEGLSYPNGIAIERRDEQSYVYVALTMAKKILVYTRTDEGRLTKCKNAIELPAAPDNLHWDASGDLWVGANSNPIKALAYLVGWRETSPSVVLRVSQLRSDAPAVEIIFSDDGGLISGSSVGCYYATGEFRKLIVGSVIENLLIVDLD